MKVEIETTTALPELRAVYDYLRKVEIPGNLSSETVNKILQHGLIQGKVHVLIKQIEWAMDDKRKEVDNFMEEFLQEAEDIKTEMQTSAIKEKL